MIKLLSFKIEVMEFKDALIFVVGLAIFTLIVTLYKMRKKQKTGYLFTNFSNDYNYKVGVFKTEGVIEFAIVIDNIGQREISIIDIYVEVKESTRYKKKAFPINIYDPNNKMIIPPGKQGGALMEFKAFKNFIQEGASFKSVIIFDDNKKHKSSALKLDMISKS